MTDTANTNSRPTIPSEYAGQWIVWDSPERTKIVAIGDSYNAAYDAAKLTGEPNPVLQKVADRKQRFIGTAK